MEAKTSVLCLKCGVYQSFQSVFFSSRLLNLSTKPMPSRLGIQVSESQTKGEVQLTDDLNLSLSLYTEVSTCGLCV